MDVEDEEGPPVAQQQQQQEVANVERVVPAVAGGVQRQLAVVAGNNHQQQQNVAADNNNNNEEEQAAEAHQPIAPAPAAARPLIGAAAAFQNGGIYVYISSKSLVRWRLRVNKDWMPVHYLINYVKHCGFLSHICAFFQFNFSTGLANIVMSI